MATRCMSLGLGPRLGGSKCDSAKTVTVRGSIASPAAYAADMTTFSKLMIVAAVLASHAAASAPNFPALRWGADVRVFTISAERCAGKVLDWLPMELTVEFREPSACGAVNGVLHIKPGDVRKVDTNVHPFWHVVTRPVAWVWAGIEVGVDFVFYNAVGPCVWLWAKVTGQL
jgi:hypothetical protein